MELKYKLRMDAKLIDIQGDYALFYLFGNRVIIKADGYIPMLKQLCDRLVTASSLVELKTVLVATEGSGDSVSKLIDLLMAHRLIEVTGHDQGGGQEASGDWAKFYARFSANSDQAMDVVKKVSSKKVSVIGCGDLAEGIFQSLGGLGLSERHLFEGIDLSLITDEDSPENRVDLESNDSDLIIVVASWADQNELLTVNREMHQFSKKWLVVFQDFFGGTITPIFGLDDELCFQCFYDRKMTHILNVDRYEMLMGWSQTYQSGISESYLPSYTRLLSETVCLEASKYLGEFFETKLFAGCFEFDFLNYRHEFHRILPTPHCTVCSDFDRRHGYYLNQKGI